LLDQLGWNVAMFVVLAPFGGAHPLSHVEIRPPLVLDLELFLGTEDAGAPQDGPLAEIAGMRQA
jgi:hypothetical protein